MSNERELFERALNEAILETECLLTCEEAAIREVAWMMWRRGQSLSTTMQDDVRKDAWLPIKTAPKQEAVLVAGGDCDYPCVANWSGMNDEPWYVDGQMNTYAEIGWPTHWQPLPSPPAIDKARE